MTYFIGGVASATNGSEVITALKAALTASGWTLSGSVYSSTVSGTTITVEFPSASLASSGMRVLVNGVDCYVNPGNSTYVGSYVHMTYSIGPGFFYVRLAGPTPGLVGANEVSYGSPVSYVIGTTYTPYLSSNSDASKHFAVISAINQGTPFAYSTASSTTALTSSIYLGHTGSGAVQSGELLTMRNAVQDVASVGDQPQSAFYGNSGIVYWPYVITSSSFGGIVGRLNNVFFSSDAYVISPGDSVVTPNYSEVFINGDRYVRHRAAYFPSSTNATGFTPLGNHGSVNNYSGGGSNAAIEPSQGGPYIMIKRGDGS